MPTLVLTTAQITESRQDGRMAHREFPETAQTIACTNVADAATKLQTALTPLVGGTTAATHATAFTARVTGPVAASRHVMSTGAGSALTAVYRP